MSWLRRVRRMVEKNRSEVLGILLRRYPSWVWGEGVPESAPAFALHGVEEAGFRALADRLVRDGYRTVTVDEYVAGAQGRRASSGREILLTFDDGHESLHRVAFPILRERGLTATAYIVPGRTADDPHEYPEGHPSRSLCSWPMLREMFESGVIDLQSHSMWHHSIPISDRVVDFHRPELKSSFLEGDLDPAPEGSGKGSGTGSGKGMGKGNAAVGGPVFGTPIHEWGARYGAAPAWRESEEVLRVCQEQVERDGGAEFFLRPGWRAELDRRVRDVRREFPPKGLESDEEMGAAVRDDLAASRAAIEESVPGTRVNHFCFPWFRGSRVAVEISRELGFLSNAWGSLLPSFVDSESVTPVPIQRFPPHFLWRLPGREQRSLGSVYRRRRAGGGGA